MNKSTRIELAGAPAAAPSLSLRFAVVARLLPRLLPVAPSLLVGIVLAESAQALLLHGEELIRLRSRQTIPIPIVILIIAIAIGMGAGGTGGAGGMCIVFVFE